jgi:hypothetical protein
MKPLEHLRQLKLAKTKEMYPNVPDIALPKIEYNDRSANGLTKCVVDFLNLSGHQAERINTMGRMIDNRKQVTDVIGRTKTIGSAKYIPTTGTKGSADISATIYGRSVKIEVKYGADRQSQAQKDYQAMIERAGGQYWIVKTFEDFYDKFKTFESNILFLNK